MKSTMKGTMIQSMMHDEKYDKKYMKSAMKSKMKNKTSTDVLIPAERDLNTTGLNKRSMISGQTDRKSCLSTWLLQQMSSS